MQRVDFYHAIIELSLKSWRLSPTWRTDTDGISAETTRQMRTLAKCLVFIYSEDIANEVREAKLGYDSGQESSLIDYCFNRMAALQGWARQICESRQIDWGNGCTLIKSGVDIVKTTWEFYSEIPVPMRGA